MGAAYRLHISSQHYSRGLATRFTFGYILLFGGCSQHAPLGQAQRPASLRSGPRDCGILKDYVHDVTHSRMLLAGAFYILFCDEQGEEFENMWRVSFLNLEPCL